MCTLVPPLVQRETPKTVKNPYALAAVISGEVIAGAATMQSPNPEVLRLASSA
jgi:hypothetical protein